MQPHDTSFWRTAALFPGWSEQYESKDQSPGTLWCWYEKKQLAAKASLAQGSWCKSWGASASCVHPKAPCPPRAPALHGEGVGSPPTPKQLTGNETFVLSALVSCISRASSQLKKEGEGITYLSVQNYLGEEKPFVCTVVFLGFPCICVATMTGTPI